MATLQAELEATKKQRDELEEECNRLRELTPATELPDVFTLLQELRAKHPLFSGKKPKCKIESTDVELILELLHPS